MDRSLIDGKKTKQMDKSPDPIFLFLDASCQCRYIHVIFAVVFRHVQCVEHHQEALISHSMMPNRCRARRLLLLVTSVLIKCKERSGEN